MCNCGLRCNQVNSLGVACDCEALPDSCYSQLIIPLDLSPLAQSLLSLEAGLREASANPLNELLRDGVIRRFSLSHELATQCMTAALESLIGDNLESMPYDDILQLASEQGLIRDVRSWSAYRFAQVQIFDVHDAATASEVYHSTLPFLTDARELLRRLHEFIDQPSA